MGILSGNSQLFPHWAGLSVAGQRWPPDDQRQSLAGLLFCKSERPRIKSTSPVSAAGPHRIYLRRPRSPGSYYVDRPPIKLTSPFRNGTRTPITNCGFRARHMIDADPSGIGTELNITSVAVAADTVIRLTCDTEPQGKVRVAYATRPQYGQEYGNRF